MTASPSQQAPPVDPTMAGESCQRFDITGHAVVHRLRSVMGHLRHANYVLAVSHSDYRVSLGGTEKFMHEEQAALRRRDISYFQLYSLGKGNRPGVSDAPDQWVGVNVDSVAVGEFTLAQLSFVLHLMHARLGARAVAVHIHHLMDFALPGLYFVINGLHTGLGSPRIRFFIHDYYSICTNHNLLKDGTSYCGGAGNEACRCDACPHGNDRDDHFAAMKTFLHTLRPEIIAPSRTAADIWARYHPGLQEMVRVVPHQIMHPSPGMAAGSADHLQDPEYRPRIAYLGYDSPVKGLATWWRVCQAENVRTHYRLFHLGSAGIERPGVTHVPVSFIRDGTDAMIHALRAHRIDIALLWSIWPETYSYTLSEAFAANCFVITTANSGNIAARVRETGRGLVFSDEEALLGFLGDPSKVKSAITVHLLENRPCPVTFNPTLAAEIAEGVTHQGPTGARPAINGPEQAPQWSTWYYLLGVLDGHPVGTLDRVGTRERLNSLQSRLAVYRMSRLHRLAEGLRIHLNRFPRLKRMLARVGTMGSGFAAKGTGDH